MSKPYVEFHEPSPANGGDATVVIPPNFPRRPAPITFTCLRSELYDLWAEISAIEESELRPVADSGEEEE